MSVHIGKIIAAHLAERGITKRHLAEQINRSRDYVYKMLERPYISTEDLVAISQALEHNFFWYFAEQLRNYPPPTSSKTDASQYEAQIEELKKERDHFLKENAYLVEINQLLKEKLQAKGSD